MFICGGSRRHSRRQVSDHPDNDDFEIDSGCSTPCSTPKCSTPKRSKRFGSYSNKNKNPYADRGLDTFIALLAELEDKKQEIITQNGSDFHDISLVQFVYSNDNQIKPIVVTKVKDQKQRLSTDSKVLFRDCENVNVADQEKTPLMEENDQKKKKKKILSKYDEYLKMENLKKPSYYLPIATILILLFLAIFGRSFAIICTSIGWYMIPNINGGDHDQSSNSNSTRLKRKKEYNSRRIYIHNKKYIVNDGPSSPRSVITGPVDHMSPRNQHSHKRSW